MKRLFYRYQAQLLRLANNRFGRVLLEFDRKFRDKKVIKISPNSVHFDNGRYIRSIHRCYPLYAKKLAAALSCLDILDTFPQYAKMDKYAGLVNYVGLTKDSRFPRIFLANIYPNAGDGTCSRRGVPSWTDARDTTDATNAYYTNTEYVCVESRKQPLDPIIWHNWRGYFPFNTSSLGIGTSVESAKLSIYISPVDTLYNDDNTSICVIKTTQSSMDTLVVSDYSALTLNNPSEGATRVPFSSLTQDTRENITLNSTGIGWIDVVGNTKLGLRTAHDVDNVAPTGNNGLRVYYSEETGTTKDPYLDITYTPASGMML